MLDDVRFYFYLVMTRQSTNRKVLESEKKKRKEKYIDFTQTAIANIRKIRMKIR